MEEDAPQERPLVSSWEDLDRQKPQGIEQDEAEATFAFYGRCSTESKQDPETSRLWQLHAATNLLKSHGHSGAISVTFFDVNVSRSLTWSQRPQGRRVLDALNGPEAARGWSNLVVGEGLRCFAGDQILHVAAVARAASVALWVPELGGPIDLEKPDDFILMMINGGLSKAEAERASRRVRHAMSAQVQIEGRFQGGRPQYGYRTEQGQLHPNPSKAGSGKRLTILAIDHAAAEHVRRIFALFLEGSSPADIARVLTEAGVPPPSQHDAPRNPHRGSTSWSASSVHVILRNARYTGYAVHGIWTSQRELIDPADRERGTRKRRTRSAMPPVRSAEPAHEAIVSLSDFFRAQELLMDKGRRPVVRRSRKSKHLYVFQGRIVCRDCSTAFSSGKYGSGPDDAAVPARVRYQCQGTRQSSREPHATSRLLQREVLLRISRWIASRIESDAVEEIAERHDLSLVARDVAVTNRQQSLSRLEHSRSQLHDLVVALGDGDMTVLNDIREAQKNVRRDESVLEGCQRDEFNAERAVSETEGLSRLFADLASGLPEFDSAAGRTRWCEIVSDLEIELEVDPLTKSVTVDWVLGSESLP